MKSRFFNKSFYLLKYPDVRKSDIDPIWHYVKYGWKESRDPSPNFSTNFYLVRNTDVEREKVNPLVHYIKHGQYENRAIKPTNSEIIGSNKENLELVELLRNNATQPPKSIDIIIFAIIDWDFRFQRPQQLSVQLSNLGHRIFYIEAGFCNATEPKINKISEKIYSVRLSIGDSNAAFNTSLSEQDLSTLESSIQILRDVFLINAAAMIVDLPFWTDLTERLRISHGWKLVYDCMDLHTGFSNNEKQVIVDEKNLLINSDLTVATSHYLLEHVKETSQNYILVSNGTDFEFFNKAKELAFIEDFQKIPSPIIGYYGAIANWFDTFLIASLAKEKPEWSFVLIGSTYLANLKPFKGLPNIHLLGEKPISEIPKYLSNFDVCIIPFKNTPLTNATNPVKMYEYLSAGKPIVATNLNEISHYSNFLKLAESKEEWVDAIEQSLNEIKSDELINKRLTFAKENDWMEKAKIIQSEILNLYPKISIIIINYKNFDYIKLCLESIYKNTSYPNYELIIVDNASDGKTVEFLKNFCNNNNNIKLILNENNLGFAKANNQAARIAEGKYLVLLNNDTIVSPGWIHRLLWHLTSNKDVGMVGPVSNGVANEAKINIDYLDTTIFNVNNFAAKQTMMNYGQSFEIKVLALFCSMISKNLFFEVDGLDERFKIGMFEDDDLAMKIHEKRLKLLCAKDVFIHHTQKGSFNLLPNDEYIQIFSENKEKFEQKWGIKWTQHTTKRISGSESQYDSFPIELTEANFQKEILRNISKFSGVFIQHPNIYWDIPLYQRPQHIATALGKLGYLVIYRIPSRKESGKGYRRVAENVWVTNLEIPNIGKFVSSIYSTAFPSVDYIIKRKKRENEILVYEYIDHISPKISVNTETVFKLNKLKKFAFKNADFIVASAHQLEEEAIIKVGPDKVLYIPNGVDVEHYRSKIHRNVRLPDNFLKFRDRYKTLVGYFGSISPWLWYEMLNELITMRKDIGFVFIGPDYQDSYSNLPKSSNLLHLDAVNYKVLPGYARLFDICFIPFAPGEIAKTTSPLKLFEYFALEKPVVVTSFMNECIAFNEVFSGDSAISISEAIDAAFSIKDEPAYKSRLAKLADDNSWMQRAKEYIKIFKIHEM